MDDNNIAVPLTAWLKLCCENKALIEEYDRLKGTNIARRGSPINLMIDDACGKYEEDTKLFFDFCVDLFMRIPPSTAH